jgi:hypothetical protein
MKKLFIIISLITIIGCGGGGDDAAPPGVVPGIGTLPIINNVVLTDEDFNPKAVFEIGDEANFKVTATDPEKNMEELIITQYYLDVSKTDPFSGPEVSELPSQSDVSMEYWLLSGTTIDGPAGNWKLEFQIADSTGLESNVFTVFAVVTSAVPCTYSILPTSR